VPAVYTVGVVYQEAAYPLLVYIHQNWNYGARITVILICGRCGHIESQSSITHCLINVELICVLNLYLMYMCILKCHYMYFMHVNVSGRSVLLFNN